MYKIHLNYDSNLNTYTKKGDSYYPKYSFLLKEFLSLYEKSKFIDKVKLVSPINNDEILNGYINHNAYGIFNSKEKSIIHLIRIINLIFQKIEILYDFKRILNPFPLKLTKKIQAFSAEERAINQEIKFYFLFNNYFRLKAFLLKNKYKNIIEKIISFYINDECGVTIKFILKEKNPEKLSFKKTKKFLLGLNTWLYTGQTEGESSLVTYYSGPQWFFQTTLDE